MTPFLPEVGPVKGCTWVTITDSLHVRDIRHNICNSLVSSTGTTVNIGFKALVDRYGSTGLSLFGAPLTSAFYDSPRKTWVPWFEKARFEHPDAVAATGVGARLRYSLKRLVDEDVYAALGYVIGPFVGDDERRGTSGPVGAPREN